MTSNLTRADSFDDLIRIPTLGGFDDFFKDLQSSFTLANEIDAAKVSAEYRDEFLGLTFLKKKGQVAPGTWLSTKWL